MVKETAEHFTIIYKNGEMNAKIIAPKTDRVIIIMTMAERQFNTYYKWFLQLLLFLYYLKDTNSLQFKDSSSLLSVESQNKV